LNKKVK